MKKIYLVLALLAGIAYGEKNKKSDITLTDGTVLEKAKILTTSPTDAVILHSGGNVENISWDKLPTELRAKYGVSVLIL